jgi:hypothetical protein
LLLVDHVELNEVSPAAAVGDLPRERATAFHLEPGPGRGRHQRLEAGLQPPPPTQLTRLPGTHGLCRPACAHR